LISIGSIGDRSIAAPQLPIFSDIDADLPRPHGDRPDSYQRPQVVKLFCLKVYTIC
jgi:hypothetical protein